MSVTAWRTVSTRSSASRRLQSVLDEFPGIGAQRKAALLKRFGSVQRLKAATLEQLAEVPGFGGKAARSEEILAARQ